MSACRGWGCGTSAAESAQGDTRGGGSIWVTGTYDPEQNLVFFGTGHPGPDYYSANREGDNLFTASIVALDADTGKLKWHYQFTPHDVHDWDATQVPVLGEVPIDGKPRKVVMFANRNGFFYVIDRVMGKLIGVRDTRFLHQPATSGTHVAFVYADDLWVARLDGSDVRRFTTDDGSESSPAFSPNGTTIAFSGQYDGNTDVFTVPAAGGVPTRLTWHPAKLWSSGSLRVDNVYTQRYSQDIDVSSVTA
ncbi:MAG: hypothetical protein Q7R30_04940 [Acidobacteriota bacterium]|nr:hypothetical protein [Acidobacteriota bacterium]